MARDAIGAKADATWDLLEYVGTRDRWFEPKYLKEIVEDLFHRFQGCLERHDFERVRGELTPEYYSKVAELSKDRKQRKSLFQLDEYDLEKVLFVHFRARGSQDGHTFTALVTARGDDKLQMYWIFHRTPKRWKLAEMSPATSSDPVTKANQLSSDEVRNLEVDPQAKDLLRHVDRTLRAPDSATSSRTSN
jgi:hypothetical protein